ncbi:MAG: peptidase S41, partial [Chitinophagaceae bacterium]|nr:peptidase S41 [Chitinophagaceae bacterium]
YYHFGFYEKHYFKPKKKNRFNGHVYIVTGGNSFSATTLFAGTLREQDNVTVIGEETGGAAYGNSAWLIPYVTLPHSKVRFRLPLFRLVTHPLKPKDGKGVQPEIFVGPSVDAIRNGLDYKIEEVKKRILASHAQ